MHQVLDILKNIGFKDVVDMTIVAFVFYKFLMLMRETRAEQLIKGIVVLLVATQVSGWMQLHVINWVLRGTMTVGLIALLIVFQPELRRGLEYIGRTKLLTKSIIDIQVEENEKMIGEIVEAVSSLSRQRIGSLLVFERTTGLNEISETGTLINGNVSRSLIINIFIPNTPLHDGATLIRRNKILAAGCLLPLTDSMNIGKDLGTRHRAGIGITERSDSIVVIVSEETGAISIAENGRLVRFVDGKKLSDYLNDAFREAEKQKWKILRMKWRHKDE
ncbi:MAG: diadenylate cyclase CdaA [Alkaliphilus sp.]